MAGKQGTGCLVGCAVLVIAVLMLLAFYFFSPQIYAFVKDLVKTSSF